MRKFTLFFAALCCAVAAHAVDYTVKFAVNGTVKFTVNLPEGTEADVVQGYGEAMLEQVMLPDYYTFREWDHHLAEVTKNVTYNALYIMKDGDLYYQVDEPTETAIVTYETRSNNYNYNYQYLTGSVIIPTEVRDNSMEFNVTGVGEYAFRACRGLTSVTIPNSVTSIGINAFHYCGSLTSVTIPNSVTSIGIHAFHYCSSLTSVTIPNSVTSIGDYAFYYCTSLSSVTIGNSVTSIGGHAFGSCKSLTSITIPRSVTLIGTGAFAYCRSLASISVENGNAYYDSRENCNAIIETASNVLLKGCKNTTIPDSITCIGYFAFAACDDLTNLSIPNSVTSIGHGAFADCISMKSIIIPSNVTKIENYAFSGCSDLRYITCQAVTPPECSGPNVFEEVKKTIPLYVPAESMEEYMLADCWSEFIHIAPAPHEGIEEVQREPSGQYKGTKVIKDGQLFIERNGKTYNALGTEIQ